MHTKQPSRFFHIFLLVLVVFFATCLAYCSDFYVAPDGDDNDDGSIDYPFATIGKAVDMAEAGDNILLRGGQHDYTSTIEISKSGTSGNLITLQNYQNESVVLDFSGQPYGSSNRGIVLSGDYWHLKGFTIQYAGDNGLNVSSSYNVMEQLVTRYNSDSGLQLHGGSGASYNLVINCDSYENCDAPNGGENADGFAAKFSLGPGNEFIQCRSWGNSDDGYDFWDAGNAVTLEDCCAFQNGINIWGLSIFGGDGNGFKLGEGTGAHVLIRCVAYNNPHHGIDVNGNQTGVTVYNCTCVDNGGRNFYFDEHSSSHVLRNNLSYLGSVTIYSEIDDEYNSWNGFSVDSGDFESLDDTGIDGSREPDGELPALSFLRLVWSSSLIDGGIDVGQPFEVSAPDLGAFERWYGDCEPDGDIDLADLEVLGLNWLDVVCGTCGGADFNGDNQVDLFDFALLANNWLTK